MAESVERRLCQLIDRMNEGRSLPPAKPESRLFDEGYIDSMGLFELLSKAEETFHITLEDRDLSKDHFTTVAALSRLLETKLANQVA